MKELAFITCLLYVSYSSGEQEPPTLAALTAKGAQVQKAGSGYAFTEGLSVASDGRVFFTDQPNDRIYVWDEKSGITMFIFALARYRCLTRREIKSERLNCPKPLLMYVLEAKVGISFLIQPGHRFLP